MELPRASGILLHVTSLPGGCGIGDVGEDAYRFIDTLAAAGQQYWQILPLGPAGECNSPYTPYSAFAGNPLLINLAKLGEARLLSEAELVEAEGVGLAHRVDYDPVIKTKTKLLKKAFENFLVRSDTEMLERYQKFCREQKFWLADFSLFMALKDCYDGAPWVDWPKKARERDSNVLADLRDQLASEIAFQQFVQFLFFSQWQHLRSYARIQGVRIIGDLPFFVAHDSSDVWAKPELFQLDQNGYPTRVAGVPPDYFSATGQLWGNPLYDWQAHQTVNYQWWLERIRTLLLMVDLARVDHFRGFEAYWTIPYGSETAITGHWEKGPGADLFAQIQQTLGTLPVIAEDLGFITPEVEALRDQFELPGLRVLQFAFDGLQANVHTPHNHVPNSVVYTGTHDNDTTLGWFTQASWDSKEYARKYLGIDSDIVWGFNRTALASVAHTAVLPLQDVLGLGTDARMNVPGVAAGNWEWRYSWDMLPDDIVVRLRDLTELYGRC